MKSIRKMLMDSGIILAILTVLAYFTAYFHQYGYLSFYGVFHADFIELGLVNVLSSFKSVIFMAILLTTLYQALLHLNMLFPETSIIGYGFVAYIIPWTMFAFIIAIMLPNHQMIVFICIMLFAFITTYVPIFELLSKKEKGKGYKEILRLRYLREKEHVLNVENIKRKINESPFLILILTVSLLFFVQWLSGYLGNYEAQKQEHYLTVKVDKNEYIIVKKFSNNNALLVSIDSKNKIINTDTLVVELKSIKEGKFKQKIFKNGLKSKYNSLHVFPRLM